MVPEGSPWGEQSTIASGHVLMLFCIVFDGSVSCWRRSAVFAGPVMQQRSLNAIVWARFQAPACCKASGSVCVCSRAMGSGLSFPLSSDSCPDLGITEAVGGLVYCPSLKEWDNSCDWGCSCSCFKQAIECVTFFFCPKLAFAHLIMLTVSGQHLKD